VVDSGGLNDTDTFLVQVVDTTDPFVAITTAESAAGTGWYNAASNDGVPGVTVDVTTGDLVGVTGLSCSVDGVDVGPLDPSGDSFVVLDGSHAVQCEASDESDNSDTATAGFDIDQTAPSIVPSVGPAAAASGWWNAATGAPTVTFTCSDATSGVVDCADAYTFGEGVDQSISGSASDAAGNTAFAAVTDIDVDLTGPSRVSFVGGGLANNGSYPYLFVPAGPTSCGALDTGSGVARCVVSGYAATVGSHAIVGAATDVAGNVGAGSLTYTVEPWKLAGFGKPVDMVGFNALKAGGSTNLKFEVFAGATELTAAQVVASVDDEQIGCSASSGPAPKTKGPGPKKPRAGVDSVGGHLSIRWDSPDLPGTCWRVTLRTLDGSSLSASFKLR
jgi:hypothetical protein